MFKGQKTLAALAVSLLFTAPVYAADEGSGEIHFKGEIIEAPCDIHPDDVDKNIDLGQVTTTHINRDHHSNKVAVDIRLINCDLPSSDNGSGSPISKVAVTFDGSAKTTGATPLLSNTSAGEATGVGVRLMDKNDTNIVLGTAAPDLDLDSSSTEQTLNFFAWMEQIDNAVNVTAGAVTANATYGKEYLTQCRIRKARELLETTDNPINIIAYSCGYTDPLHFSKSFHQNMGMSPSQYRNSNQKKIKNNAESR